MSYDSIRETLQNYYFDCLPEIAERIRVKVYTAMDEYAREHKGLSAYRLKAKLYETIAETVEPRIFADIPYFFETGALVAYCDGSFNRGADHANGWLYVRNRHLFSDIDPHALQVYNAQKRNGLYAQCGIYTDMLHLGLPLKKVFKVGLRGVMEELEAAGTACASEKEEEFIACAMAGIRALCRIAQRFSEAAKAQGQTVLAQTAAKVPLNPPTTVYEGLCVLAFMRKALGSLEGMGFSSFGRVDMLLQPLYDRDMERGVSREELLDRITRFLLIWDCTLDRRKPMEKWCEYEMENSLTLGGCDPEGKPIFNGITELLLEARNAEGILYPKMMLRYSANSPQDYLEMISGPLLEGKSFSLFANDDSIIPALLAAGTDREDALDYAVGGCWDILMPDVFIHNSGEYLNILKPLEWSIHRDTQKMQETELYFEPLEEAESFEELYSRYLGFIRRVLVQKLAITSRGSRIWDQVNPVGAISALMQPCIPGRRDITAGSSKYCRETAYLCGFAESVDSLLAIRKLCFEQRVCTVSELFAQCRENWPDEILRRRAIGAPSYGDGSDESAAFVGRFVEDISQLTEDLPTAHTGKLRLGSNLYTEIIWWAQRTLATPNGRKHGDYLSQGLTPSRLSGEVSAFEVLDGLRCTDMTQFAAGSSITLTLPAGRLDKARLVDFFRAAARSGFQSIQPNLVNREELRAAQTDPEHYRHIIVRVCGFSAPFVSLAPHYQEEFLSRALLEV